MSSDARDADHRPRQLVVCCDGTSNTLTAHTRDTNVLRLYERLCCVEFADPAQERVFYYDPGVGHSGLLPPTDLVDGVRRAVERLAGLASGRGVYDNVAQAYLFLMRHWRDERDRIYCFGFSRGAFTARCVVGMVNLFGLLKPEHEALLPTLVHIYFSLPSDGGAWWQRAARWLHGRLFRRLRESPVETTREQLARQVRDTFTGPHRHDAWVHWVGVWDTVESVGLPGPLSRSNPSTATLRGKRIRHVRHALAFDEHRWTFEPRLYEEPDDIDDARTGQTLRQRWFTGAHCDVGGGYLADEAALSDHTLRWMLDELDGEFGLSSPAAVVAAAAAPAAAPVPATAADPAAAPGIVVRPVRHDALHDTAWWALAGMCLRDMRPRTAARPAAPPQPVRVRPGPPAEPPPASAWTVRRPAWPLALAVLAGTACLLLSGACLGKDGWHGLRTGAGIVEAACRTVDFARDQLAALNGGGLLGSARVAGWREAQPAWAMVWDLAFVACWGYLVARTSSRGFARLAGLRRPGQPLPWWRGLGMAPLAAVGGDVAEDVGTLLALALDGLGIDLLARASLWLGAAAGVVKIVGLLGCAVWLVVRLWIALPGVPRWPHDREGASPAA